MPVLALGGVGAPDQAEACVAAGAAGVAVMGAVMRELKEYAARGMQEKSTEFLPLGLKVYLPLA